MTSKFSTVDALFRATAFAGLCLLGSAVAAADAPTKVAKRTTARVVKKKAPAAPVYAGPPEALAEQIDAAEKVYYGVYDCEFKQRVDIEKNAKYGSYVNVKSGKSTWLMKPVLSTTGAIRLEDVGGETLMVQISSKSMLLNVKTAHRIVDDCVSPRQRELIEEARVAKAAAAKDATDAASRTDSPPNASAMATPTAAK